MMMQKHGRSSTTSRKVTAFDFDMCLMALSAACSVQGILGDTKPVSSESRSEASAFMEH